MKKLKGFIPIAFIFSSLLFSCKEYDDTNYTQVEEQNLSINKWIYDNMDLYYYWNDKLPVKEENLDRPDDYFFSLLNTPEDRFSNIFENYDELQNALNGQNFEAGYEFQLYLDGERPNGVLGQIEYIKESSPASTKDIQRGDIFKSVNNTALTTDNYQQVLGDIYQNHELQIERYNSQINDFEPLGDISFSVQAVDENPIYLDTVYTISNKKIGYLIYTIFTPSKTGDTTATYLEEMDDVFASFKAEGVQHMIIDLRYNGGGAESATINLASLLGKNVDENNVFVRREYNPGLEQYIIDEFGQDFLIKTFENKAENIGAQLQDPEMIVLTSSRTASASELLINGLLPYMNVTIIGDTTVGKNMGSIVLGEEDNPDNNWGMLPLVTKSFNSKNQSDYSRGFYPDIALKDNELIKYKLGDVNEKLLQSALNYISGDVSLARRPIEPSSQKDLGNILNSSRANKTNFGILIVDDIK